MDKELLSEMREYAWKYFSLHADQRMKSFNFYIIMSTVTIGGMLTVIKESINILYALPVALLFTFISFIFWKLDIRNKQFIINSENALKYIEEHYGLECSDGIPHILNIFQYEEHMTKKLKRFPKVQPFKAHFSYSTCFNAVFIVFGISGLLSGFIILLARYI